MSLACDAGTLAGTEALCYGFVRRALTAALAVGLVCPLVGTFLVHRRLSLIGDALAHTAFAGVALGLFLGSVLALPVPPTATALVVAALGALLVQAITERTDADGDVAMAIVLSGGFATGTVLVGLTDGGLSVGIKQYLFGSLATVTPANVALLVGLVPVVAVAVGLSYRQLLYLAVDETAATVARVNVRRYERLLVLLTALVVVAAMQILGVILVAAMLVVPVAAAAQVAGSFRTSLLLGVAFAEVAALSGVALSYGYGLAGGGAVVLAAIGIYVAAVAYRTVRPIA